MLLLVLSFTHPVNLIGTSGLTIETGGASSGVVVVVVVSGTVLVVVVSGTVVEVVVVVSGTVTCLLYTSPPLRLICHLATLGALFWEFPPLGP